MAKIFANNLKKLREVSGKKQREVADFAGVKLRTYQKWEHGESEPRGESLTKLCSYFRVDQAKFYKENGMMIAAGKEGATGEKEKGADTVEDLIDKARIVLAEGEDDLYSRALAENIRAFFHAVASRKKLLPSPLGAELVKPP